MQHAIFVVVAVVVVVAGCPNTVNVGDCPDVGGDWTQSWVCFDEPSALCERDDADTFSITQTGCESVDSDVVGGFEGTRTDADDGTVTIEWTAIEGNYEEAGSWIFSDVDNFTSDSEFTFTFTDGGSGGGPCRAVGRRGGAPTPVACGSICDGASNVAETCPDG